MRSYDPRVAEATLRATRTVVEACSKLRLECRESPIASTGLLKSMGFSDYEVRRFWRFYESVTPLKLLLYSFAGFEFHLILNVRQAPLHELEYKGLLIPLDPLDEGKLGREQRLLLRYSPRSNVLHAYLEGRVGGEIKVNTVRILRLVEERIPGYTARLVDAVLEHLWAHGRHGIEDIVWDIVASFRGLLRVVLPRVPSSKSEVRELFPIATL